MTDKKTILYVKTSDNPERQYFPFIFAQTAKAMDLKPQIYFLGQAFRVLKPDVDDLLEDLTEALMFI